jgi:large subunit ribosomal protein L25
MVIDVVVFFFVLGVFARLVKSDLKLPEGIKAVRRGTLNPAIVTATVPKVEEEVVAAPVVAADKKGAAKKKDEKQNKK